MDKNIVELNQGELAFVVGGNGFANNTMNTLSGIKKDVIEWVNYSYQIIGVMLKIAFYITREVLELLMEVSQF